MTAGQVDTSKKENRKAIEGCCHEKRCISDKNERAVKTVIEQKKKAPTIHRKSKEQSSVKKKNDVATNTKTKPDSFEEETSPKQLLGIRSYQDEKKDSCKDETEKLNREKCKSSEYSKDKVFTVQPLSIFNSKSIPGISSDIFDNKMESTTSGFPSIYDEGKCISLASCQNPEQCLESYVSYSPEICRPFPVITQEDSQKKSTKEQAQQDEKSQKSINDLYDDNMKESLDKVSQCKLLKKILYFTMQGLSQDTFKMASHTKEEHKLKEESSHTPAECSVDHLHGTDETKENRAEAEANIAEEATLSLKEIQKFTEDEKDEDDTEKQFDCSVVSKYLEDFEITMKGLFVMLHKVEIHIDNFAMRKDPDVLDFPPDDSCDDSSGQNKGGDVGKSDRQNKNKRNEEKKGDDNKQQNNNNNKNNDPNDTRNYISKHEHDTSMLPKKDFKAYRKKPDDYPHCTLDVADLQGLFKMIKIEDSGGGGVLNPRLLSLDSCLQFCLRWPYNVTLGICECCKYMYKLLKHSANCRINVDVSISKKCDFCYGMFQLFNWHIGNCQTLHDSASSSCSVNICTQVRSEMLSNGMSFKDLWTTKVLTFFEAEYGGKDTISMDTDERSLGHGLLGGSSSTTQSSVGVMDVTKSKVAAVPLKKLLRTGSIKRPLPSISETAPLHVNSTDDETAKQIPRRKTEPPALVYNYDEGGPFSSITRDSFVLPASPLVSDKTFMSLPGIHDGTKPKINIPRRTASMKHRYKEQSLSKQIVKKKLERVRSDPIHDESGATANRVSISKFLEDFMQATPSVPYLPSQDEVDSEQDPVVMDDQFIPDAKNPPVASSVRRVSFQLDQTDADTDTVSPDIDLASLGAPTIKQILAQKQFDDLQTVSIQGRTVSSAFQPISNIESDLGTPPPVLNAAEFSFPQVLPSIPSRFQSIPNRYYSGMQSGVQSIALQQFGVASLPEQFGIALFPQQNLSLHRPEDQDVLQGIGTVQYGNSRTLAQMAKYWGRLKRRYRCGQNLPKVEREEGIILTKKLTVTKQNRYQEDFQWMKVVHLGSGVAGRCHLAYDLDTETESCVKIIDLMNYYEDELILWADLEHRHIVKLYGAMRYKTDIYIFSELIHGGSLSKYILEGRMLLQWQALSYFQQLLQALVYLTKKRILHEDIKGDNIMLRDGCIGITLTDFGLARTLARSESTTNPGHDPVGAQTSWSPEKAASEGHGFTSDVWAATCVLVHMLTGYHPWVRKFGEASVLHFIIKENSPPIDDIPEGLHPLIRDVIVQGWEVDAEKRQIAEQLLMHPSFKLLEQPMDHAILTAKIPVSNDMLDDLLMQPVRSTEILESIREQLSKEDSEANVPESVNPLDADTSSELGVHDVTGDDSLEDGPPDEDRKDELKSDDAPQVDPSVLLPITLLEVGESEELLDSQEKTPSHIQSMSTEDGIQIGIQGREDDKAMGSTQRNFKLISTVADNTRIQQFQSQQTRPALPPKMQSMLTVKCTEHVMNSKVMPMSLPVDINVDFSYSSGELDSEDIYGWAPDQKDDEQQPTENPILVVDDAVSADTEIIQNVVPLSTTPAILGQRPSASQLPSLACIPEVVDEALMSENKNDSLEDNMFYCSSNSSDSDTPTETTTDSVRTQDSDRVFEVNSQPSSVATYVNKASGDESLLPFLSLLDKSVSTSGSNSLQTLRSRKENVTSFEGDLKIRDLKRDLQDETSSRSGDDDTNLFLKKSPALYLEIPVSGTSPKLEAVYTRSASQPAQEVIKTSQKMRRGSSPDMRSGGNTPNTPSDSAFNLTASTNPDNPNTRNNSRKSDSSGYYTATATPSPTDHWQGARPKTVLPLTTSTPAKLDKKLSTVMHSVSSSPSLGHGAAMFGSPQTRGGSAKVLRQGSYASGNSSMFDEKLSQEMDDLESSVMLDIMSEKDPDEQVIELEKMIPREDASSTHSSHTSNMHMSILYGKDEYQHYYQEFQDYDESTTKQTIFPELDHKSLAIIQRQYSNDQTMTGVKIELSYGDMNDDPLTIRPDKQDHTCWEDILLKMAALYIHEKGLKKFTVHQDGVCVDLKQFPQHEGMETVKADVLDAPDGCQWRIVNCKLEYAEDPSDGAFTMDIDRIDINEI